VSVVVGRGHLYGCGARWLDGGGSRYIACRCCLTLPLPLHLYLLQVMNGCIVETNKQNIMAPIMLMDKYTSKGR
jgi:hypothetical protein